jgi:hypothetical protein
MQHGVSSSLFPGVVRVGLCKWARFRCSRNEPSFLVELRMPISTAPTWGYGITALLCSCRLARQASAGPAVYAVKERGQPMVTIDAFLILTSFPA